MADETSTHLGSVRIEVLGRADLMTPDELASVREISEFLGAEGIETEALYFREPGGMGFVLGSIALFVAGGVVGGAAWDGTKAAGKAAIAWARKRIDSYREARGEDLADEEDPAVMVRIYGQNGEVLRRIEVRHSGTDDPLGDLASDYDT